jgi:hypothetical protein
MWIRSWPACALEQLIRRRLNNSFMDQPGAWICLRVPINLPGGILVHGSRLRR